MAKSVSKGDTIAVEYKAMLANGEVIDKSEGREPLKFTVGAGEMIQGFDEAVVGMKLGEEKSVIVPPEKAYGKSGGHELAGKTMKFWIKVVKIE